MKANFILNLKKLFLLRQNNGYRNTICNCRNKHKANNIAGFSDK